MQEIIASIISFIITLVAFCLRNTISLGIYSYHEYPQFTSIVLTLFGIYFCYKFMVRIFKMWLNFVIYTMKVVLILSVVFVLALIYVRGFDRLINQDWPFLKMIIGIVTSSSDKSSWSNVFTSSGGQRIIEDGANFLEEIGVEDPYAYVDYVKENFDDRKDYSFEGFEYVFNGVKDFLAGSEFLFQLNVTSN